MANTSFNPLGQWRGRVGGLVYKVVDGKQIITPYTGAPYNPRTEAQMQQRAKFALAGMISKIVPAEALVGMSDQRSQRRRLFFSNIVRHATTATNGNGITASIAANNLVFSTVAASPVTVTNVTSSGGIVSAVVSDVEESVDAVMAIAVVYDTTLGIYTHTVYEVLPSGTTDISLDTREASSGDIAHLYAVPLSLSTLGQSYTRSADGAELGDTDGFALTMLLRTNDGAYRYGRSQYLTTVDLGTGATNSAGTGTGNGSGSGNTSGSGNSSSGSNTGGNGGDNGGGDYTGGDDH